MKTTKIDNLEIFTPFGWKPFDGVSKIENVPKLKFTLEGYEDPLIVSFNHEFIVDGESKKAINFVEGEVLEELEGYVKIEEIQLCGQGDVFDILDVKSPNHGYYTNEILSHNCKFIGSSNTLIEGDVLERIETEEPIDVLYNGLLEIFERPQQGAFYMLGVDSAEGTGNDNSVVQILKINSEFDIEQVAVYHNNMIEAYQFAEVCIGISDYYNKAYMMIENNNVGSIVANAIWYDYDCDRIVNCDKKGIGIRSTKKTKLAANLMVKRYIENGWLGIRCRQTVYELSLYEEISPNVFKAGKYEHDDFVTSLIWALYFLSTAFFDGKELDVKKIDPKFIIDTNDVNTVTLINDGDDGEANDFFNSGPGDFYDDDPNTGWLPYQ